MRRMECPNPRTPFLRSQQLSRVPGIAVDECQLPRIDIYHQTVYRNAWKIRTGADNADHLFDIHMHILEDAEPAQQAVHIAQLLLLDQRLWIYAERLHGCC